MAHMMAHMEVRLAELSVRMDPRDEQMERILRPSSLPAIRSEVTRHARKHPHASPFANYGKRQSYTLA